MCHRCRSFRTITPTSVTTTTTPAILCGDDRLPGGGATPEVFDQPISNGLSSCLNTGGQHDDGPRWSLPWDTLNIDIETQKYFAQLVLLVRSRRLATAIPIAPASVRYRPAAAATSMPISLRHSVATSRYSARF